MNGGKVAIHTKPVQPTVLIVEDDEGAREILDSILPDSKYHTIKVSTAEKALEILSKTHINIMLLDIRLPGMSGIALLEEINDKFDDLDVVVVTEVKDVEFAVKAMKYGVYEYITKDVNIEDIAGLVEKVAEKQKKSREVVYLRSEIKQYTDMDFVASQNPRMAEINNIIKKVANLPTTVLLQGESGTGKELVARSIHKESDKEDSPFIAVNITSVPDTLMDSFLFGHEKGAFTGALRQYFGKFELANNGTLFLDEIGDLKYDLQAKLLRVIQEGEFERIGGATPLKVNVRLIAATNKNIEKMVEDGTFREDLFYRINVVPIKLPALCERKEDLPALVEYFLNKYNKKFHKSIKGISQEALNSLYHYRWPGNIRELENLIERLVAILDKPIISYSDIPVEYLISDLTPEGIPVPSSDFLRKACDTFEKNYILREMEKVGWNRKEAARRLGIPISTLKYKLSKLDLYKSLKQRRSHP